MSEEKPHRDFSEVFRRIRNAFAVLLSLSVLGVGGWFVATNVQSALSQIRDSEDYIGEGGLEIEVVIPEGASGGVIAKVLEEADVVKTKKSFEKAASANEDSKKIQPGKYRLRKQMPANLALTMLLDPINRIRNQLRLPDGRRLSQQVSVITKATGLKKKDVKSAFNAPEAAGVPVWNEGKTVEGFLYPDTYEIADNSNAKVVVQTAVKQFKNVVDNLDFSTKAQDLGLRPYEALVLASIIEREAGTNDEDRAKIARVFLNRLQKGMLLQSDATVAYATKKTGTVWTTAEDRQSNSPYNTYRFKGLPPEPITSPSRKSLEAAVNPAKGKWLYFVVVELDNGTTEFNITVAGHNKSSQKLQEWCRASEENREKCA